MSLPPYIEHGTASNTVHRVAKSATCDKPGPSAGAARAPSSASSSSTVAVAAPPVGHVAASSATGAVAIEGIAGEAAATATALHQSSLPAQGAASMTAVEAESTTVAAAAAAAGVVSSGAPVAEAGSSSSSSSNRSAAPKGRWALQEGAFNRAPPPQPQSKPIPEGRPGFLQDTSIAITGVSETVRHSPIVTSRCLLSFSALPFLFPLPFLPTPDMLLMRELIEPSLLSDHKPCRSRGILTLGCLYSVGPPPPVLLH